jgi:hypothetical protein
LLPQQAIDGDVDSRAMLGGIEESNVDFAVTLGSQTLGRLLDVPV